MPVPERRALVTDTHPLLLHAAGGRLGSRARAHFSACDRREALAYVPAAVIWETSLLARIGRIELGGGVREFFEKLFANPAYQALDLTREQVYLAHEARPNDDPFDGLICAAARSLDLPLLTRDRAIQEWGRLRTLW